MTILDALLADAPEGLRLVELPQFFCISDLPNDNVKFLGEARWTSAGAETQLDGFRSKYPNARIAPGTVTYDLEDAVQRAALSQALEDREAEARRFLQ